MVCEAQGCFNKANKEIRIPIGTVGEISVSVCNNGKQEFYYPYCFKIIIAERSPDETKAKGVLDRTFVFNTYHGKPKYDVKEILPAGDISVVLPSRGNCLYMRNIIGHKEL